MSQEQIWNLAAKKLAGEASAEELEQLEELLSNNPGLHYPLQIIADLWTHKRHEINQTADHAFDRHAARMKRMNLDFNPDQSKIEQYHSLNTENLAARNKGRIKMIFLGSAFLLLVIGAIVIKYVIPGMARQEPLLQSTLSEISTRNGSKSNVVLPDGTIVKLNADSKLTYDKDFGNRIREVNLIGEGFFDVVKNKEKPFIIHTRKIDIKVLGTTFDVKSYPNESTETSLVRGSIEVTFKDRPSEKVILKPNEKLIVAADDLPLNSSKTKSQSQALEPIVAISHLNYTRRDSTIIETAWVQNKLIFRNETFKQLALQMERWYNVSIFFEDSVAESLSFTGIFENETVQQALDALQMSGKFNYRVKDNEIFISK